MKTMTLKQLFLPCALLLAHACSPAAMAQYADTTDVLLEHFHNVTGALGGTAQSLNQEQMNRKQVSNPLDAINGRVAGLTVQKNNNGVAAMNAVRVRGTTSITGGNDPLVIVDGVFGDLSTLSSICPTDIESFTILKDASETAQYGSRGASGVIEVKTKRGVSGRATVSYNGSFGFTRVFKNLNMLNAEQYVKQVTSMGLPLDDRGANTNWQREIEQTGFKQDHHVAFMGGGENSGYRISLGFLDHNGTILHENLRNFTSNMSMYQNMFNGVLKIDVGMFGNIQNNKTSVFDVQKTFYSAQAYNPTFPAKRNEGGTWDGFTLANQLTHPLALMDSRTTDKTSHISTHVKLKFKLSEHLNLGVFGAYSHNEVESNHFYPTYIWAHGEAYRGNRKTESLLGNAVLTYKRNFGRHTIDLMALGEVERDIFTGFHTTTTNFNTNALGYDAIQGGALRPWEGTASYREAPSMTAFMARAAYDFADRYSLTATARIDGSSKFGKNNKWGFFPSLSAAWNIIKEPFLSDVRWISNLKLRLGYGLAGNQGGIDNYMSMNLFSPTGVVPVGNQAAVSLGTLKNINPDLKWEVKRTFNVGLDAAFWDNRIIGTVDFYTSKTTDMLYMYNVSVPPFFYSKLLDNLGSMRNSGVEVALGITPLSTPDMELNISANVAYQYNKLLSLSGYYGDYYITAPQYVDIASLNGAGFHGGNNHIVYQIVGQPLGVFYLPHCTGLVDNGHGGKTYQIADLDGDGVINIGNGADRRVCGQAVPKVTMGSNISFRYKHCDISMQINGAFGHKIYNGTALTYMNMNSLPGYNVLAEAPSQGIADQTATDYWLERGDYVNFDYVTVGWNVPLRTRHVSNLRLSLTVDNLATITGYSGLTPMINSSNVNGTLGVDDKNIYPVARSFALGVTITF